MQIVRAFGEERLFNVHYWRDNTKEVDIVIDKKTDVLPIEVKYRNSISIRDLKELKAFVEKFNVNCSVVITKDILKVEDDIVFIPFWMIKL